MVAGIFTGTCAALVEVATGDEPEPFTTSVPMTAGQSVYIQTADWGTVDGGGAYRLTITVQDIDPLLLSNRNPIVDQPVNLLASGNPSANFSDVEFGAAGLIQYDNFTLLEPRSAASVTAWGVFSTNSDCIESPTTIRVSFYNDNAGAPGSLFSSQDVVVVPEAVLSESPQPPFFTLYRLDIPLNVAVPLPTSAWISLQGISTTVPFCRFAWSSSPTGDNVRYEMLGSDAPVRRSRDRAFSLHTAPFDVPSFAHPVLSFPFDGVFTNRLNSSTGIPGSCNTSNAPTMDNSSWFTFASVADRIYRVRVDPEVEPALGFDEVAVMATGTPGALIEIACGDEPEPFTMSAAVGAGEQIYVGIGDWGTFDGGGTYRIIIDIPCPTDLDADAATGTSDLLILLATWGTDNPAGDINSYGTTGTSDLLALLAAWGQPCL